MLKQNELIALLKAWGKKDPYPIFWKHDGNNKRPHAELTSKKHSDGFFNGSGIIAFPDRTTFICGEMIQHLFKAGVFPRTHFDRIFGSSYGANDLSFELGRQMHVPRGFTDKGEGKSMINKRFYFPKGTRILPCEDVLTTGDTTRNTISALEESDAVVINIVLVLCNRSGLWDLDGRKIISPLDIHMPTWDVPEGEECPLCKAGSEALRPKGNWDKLTAKYS